jgi:hypothetical protein
LQDIGLLPVTASLYTEDEDEDDDEDEHDSIRSTFSERNGIRKNHPLV